MMSERKRLAAIANAKKGSAATRARVDALPKWHCAECGKEAPGTAHQMRHTYCSKACMAAGYAKRMMGQENPNFRSAGLKQCEACGKAYHAYNKARKYCSLDCRPHDKGNLGDYTKKDANHDAIVASFRASGVWVIDLSRQAGGCPDLLVWVRASWHMVEVKNPSTEYGRRGLSQRQRKWAIAWKPCPYFVVESESDVQALLRNDLNDVWTHPKHAASVGEALEAVEAL
jgi:endogenous inhibitor of DNA gyrase (YacG/DUF329 family)